MNQRSLWIYCASLLALTAGCGNDESSMAAGASNDGGAAKNSPKKPKSSASGTKDAGSGSTGAGMSDGGIMRKKPDAETPAAMGEGLVSNYLADAGDGWKSLVQAHWILSANSEQYRCARLTITQDVAVHTFRAVSPLGTHHTLLTVTRQPTEPDGLTVCNAGTNAPGMLTGSGVGTNDYTLPDGVAVKLHKGEQLLINLHLFNVSDHEIEGTSGTLVKTMTDDQIMHEAEAILAGPTSISVPPHSMNVVQSGPCTMTADATLIALGAHAHMHANHIKVTVHSSIAGDVVIHDRDYSFDNQLIYLIDPIQVKQGDKIETACTYDNTGDKEISFGDSSLAEMCFAGIVRYPPAPTPNFFCTQ
jgi:hypothetical protein